MFMNVSMYGKESMHLCLFLSVKNFMPKECQQSRLISDEREWRVNSVTSMIIE